MASCQETQQMQHNNNNVIANELNNIILSLADTDSENISDSLEVIDNKISHLEQLSQEMNIPELRALTHWMMLNIELDNDNKEQVTTLLENGSYYKWMEILSMLLQSYDQSLLPIIYKALTEPNWLVKPSAPLLRNLASWIESVKISTDSSDTLSSNSSEELNNTSDTNVNNEQSSTELLDDIEHTDKYIFEDIESAILEKNYKDTGALDNFTEDVESNSIKVTADEKSNYYEDIEENIIIDSTEKLFLENEETSSTDQTPIVLEENAPDNINIENVKTLKIINGSDESENLDTDDFSMEVDDIVMTLTTISASTDDPLIEPEDYIAELQRFEMLAEISGYLPLLPISNWCQKNISLFSQNPSDNLRQFVETGECWTWIELTKLAIAEPDELSTISELNAELNRDEWLEPLAIEDLEPLILFLQDPLGFNDKDIPVSIEATDNIVKADEESVKLIETSTEESSDLSFKWEDDVHPELLEVYFEETAENIILITEYLSNIGKKESTKEQRQDARRIAHTIKGGSAVVGITALSTYAYQLEKILDYGIDHSLATESHELLHSAATCVESLYKSIQEKKAAPDDFPTILSQLINYAEVVEELDDEPLELSAPVLPDFISQQNAEKEAEISVNNIIDDTVDIVENDENLETTVEKEIREVKVENIESTIETKVDEILEKEESADIEENALPTLSQNDDLSDFTAELDDIVMTLVTSEIKTEKQPFKLDAYFEELQRLDMLSEISGYPEVAKISSWCQNNLALISKKGTKNLGEFISSGESWTWIELISACLTDPEEISHLSALSAELTREDWLEPIDIEALQSLLLVLRSPTNLTENTGSVEEPILEIENTEPSIPTEIEDTVEEIPSPQSTNIISWDEDVHPELLSVYLQETSEQVTKIAELLHLISKSKANKEQQEHAARIAHTIKGASGVVGITEIVDFTHKLEDILDYAVNNTIPEETAELLAESSDCLESLFEAVQNKSEAPEEFKSVLAKLTTYAEFIESDLVAIDEPIELKMPELPDFIIQEESNFKQQNDKIEEKPEDKNIVENTILNDSFVEDNSLLVEDSGLNKIESVESDNKKQAASPSPTNISASDSHIRVPTTLINKLLNLAGELVTTSGQVSDKVEKTLLTSIQMKEQDKRVHNMLDELTATIYKQEKNQMRMLSNMQNKDFDSLEMDTYNELHSVAGLLTESILDSETIESTLKQQLSSIHDELRSLDNLNKELSETILSSRMESLNTLIPRLERIVRQTCRKTNKKAELIVTGNDINIDTEILSGLADPLLHLLRNAIDHGIEQPNSRSGKKKKQTGKIQLDFSRQGNFIHMVLSDDGAGIDSEKIYQSAINKGLITPNQEYSKSEVLKLILEPGFSTQKDVTDISGRGVGMDVVNKGIKALKGSLTINSELGKGSSFEVKIPLTLVTSSTLLVETAGNKVAIPTDSIEQLYYLSPEDVLDRKGKKLIRHEGKELVIESLAGILGWTVNDVDFTKAQTLLLIKGSQQLHAIYIDQIIHSREVVIKSLSHFIDDTNGVIGACHLSDGAVAPVMNLPQLLSRNEKSSYTVKQLDDTSTHTTTVDTTPQILVVDDSLSNRKALSLIIDKTEYDVLTAVDGLDALSVINENHIDLVFTDLEMPRMTGLELTQAIRAWDEKKNIPIVMVTSRSTNKHRELAKKAGVDDYLTKPVGTDTLLESMETWLKQDVTV